MVAKFLDLNKPKSCKVGGHNLSLPVPHSPASSTFLSLSHPTSHAVYCVSPLSCKSRCLTPCSNRESFGLVQNKKWCCKSNHFALSSAIIEAAFLRHNFTPHSKIFNVLWTRVVRIELPGRSSIWMDFSPPHRRIRDRSKWSLTTFHLARFVVLTDNFDS